MRSAQLVRLASAVALLVVANSCSDSSAPATAVKVGFLVNPGTVTAGTAIAPALTIAAQDASGTTITGVSASVTLSITAGTGTAGATLGGTLTRAAVNGVATFDDITIDKSGTGYSLTATAVGLTIATTTVFNVSAGAPAKLVIGTQPSNVASAAAVGPAVTITVQDANSNAATTATTSITVAITGSTGTSGATLGGTKTVSAVAGVATFNDLTIDKAGTGYTLAVTATGLTGATSSAFNVTPGAAAKLAVSAQPSSAVSGAAIAPAVGVTVQDAAGNTVTSSTASITVAVTVGTGTGGAALGGTKTVSAASGVASFSTLTVDKTGTGYTLSATATGLTSATSSAFNITAGAAAKLAFTVQPGNTVASAVITAPVQVTVQDANGNTVTGATNSVTIAIGTNAGGSTLGGTVTAAAVSGVATFSTLTLNNLGTGYTLTASATGLTGATSSTFNIVAGAANRLAFTVQPSNTAATAVITAPVQVTVQDANGNTVTGATNSVTIAIGTNAGGSTLGGTATAAAVSGVATFSTLTLNNLGTGYTLTASATGLTGATSSTFNIVVGAANKLAFSVQPASAVSMVVISPTVEVIVQDVAGNTVTTATNSITMNTGFNPSSGTLGGTLTKAAVAGVATFNNLTLDKSGTGYKLQAAATGLTTALSNTFNITHAAAAKLDYQFNPPVTTVSMVAMSPAIKIVVQDAQSNTVTSSTASITMALTNNPAGGTLSGTATSNAVAGIATFSDLKINKVASNYRLGATSSGLTSSPNSDLVEITVGAAATIAVSAGNGVSSTAGNATGTVPEVLVTDAGGNPVSGVSVTFLVTGGGGIATGLSKSTNASGLAAVNTWTLGNTAGANTMTATSSGLTGSPVTFTQTGVAGNANNFIQTAGSFTGRSSTAVTVPPSVKVVDVHGNGVSGATVNFAVAGGGGGITGGTGLTTDVNGIATLGSWTLGPSTSANQLDVTGGGLPTLAITVDMFASLWAGHDHTCALATTGNAYCWGNNEVGELGDSTYTNRSQPVPVKGGLIFESMLAGPYLTCGKTYAGAVYCWGDNNNGIVGNGVFSANVLYPSAVIGGNTYSSLARSGSSPNHACALVAGGDAWCWGYNNQGQLGLGDLTNVNQPNVVGSGGVVFSAIAVGSAVTCAIQVTTNAAYCWGQGFYGAIGDGFTTQRKAPVAVSGGLAFSKLAIGKETTCGITTGNVAYCWGSNNQGTVGDNSPATPRTTPVTVNGSHTFTSITMGDNHACALDNTNAAWCWGRNTEGQLGDGSNTQRDEPVAVSGGLTFSSIVAGQNHTCGWAGAGTVYCWGANNVGQIGDATLVAKNVPTLLIHK